MKEEARRERMCDRIEEEEKNYDEVKKKQLNLHG